MKYYTLHGLLCVSARILVGDTAKYKRIGAWKNCVKCEKGSELVSGNIFGAEPYSMADLVENGVVAAKG